ncbi:unnamed protein product [Heterobilharzia americana]|nr:unnamed protein product [Heterobilharzia americana]
MVAWIHKLLLNLLVLFLYGTALTYGAHSWTSSESLPIANSSEIVPHDANSSRLGYIKVGLAAAFFFTVLVSCGLPVLLIDYLRERNNVSSHDDNRRFHLGKVQQNGSGQIKIDQDNEEGEQNIEFQYCDLSLPSNAERNFGNCLSDDQFTDNKQNNTSWKRIPLQHQTSVESEILSTPGQSPNPALINADQFENRDLLTGQVVHTERNWPNVFRIQDRMLGRNLNDHSTMQNRRGYQKEGKQKYSPKAVYLSRAARKEKLQLWFSRCNCFAAGVFLSSGFMELYPDTEEAITEAKHQLNIKSEFPFAPFLTLVGFFLVLSIEQIVWTTKSEQWICCRRRNITSQALHRDSLNSVDNDYNVERRKNHYFDKTNNNINPTIINESNQLHHNNMEYTSSNVCNIRTNQVEQRVDIEPHHPLDDDDDDYGNDNNKHNHHSHTHDIKFDAKSFGSVLRVILLLCAMSVHSIFEGLAVGLQPTAQRTLALFTAILLHKVIIAIGIGVNLATSLNESSTNSSFQSKSSYFRILMYQSIGTLILACSSPFGVLVGYGLMQQKQSAILTMSTAVLQGLACGTFFYVVFCELLPVEFKEGVKDRMGKFFFLLLGFILVALYAFLMPE